MAEPRRGAAMIKVLDKLGEGLVAVVREDGLFDQAVDKFLAVVLRRGAIKQQEKVK